MPNIIPQEAIERKILILRGKKVMLDRDLARLYGVETRSLNQAVRRNKDRFPEDFMFLLDKREFENWKSQIVMSKADRQGLRHPPLAFTEQGIAMLSSVLNSKSAIQVNIQIMRTFTNLRQYLSVHEDLRRKIESVEKKTLHHDRLLYEIFTLLKKMIDPPKLPEKPKSKMGFTA